LEFSIIHTSELYCVTDLPVLVAEGGEHCLPLSKNICSLLLAQMYWQENQTKVCTGLQVVDHYENPRNVGSFEKGDANVGTGLVGAPACGDVMRLQIRSASCFKFPPPLPVCGGVIWLQIRPASCVQFGIVQ